MNGEPHAHMFWLSFRNESYFWGLTYRHWRVDPLNIAFFNEYFPVI